MTRQRRTKAEINPSILDTVVAVLSLGAGRQAAAAQAGISDETLRQYEAIGEDAWQRRDEALLDGTPAGLTPREELFADFYERVMKADSKTKAYALGVIQKASGGDWRAAAWLLEKLYPGDFGARVAVDATHSGSVEQRLDLSRLSADELWQLRELRRKIDPGSDS